MCSCSKRTIASFINDWASTSGAQRVDGRAEFSPAVFQLEEAASTAALRVFELIELFFHGTDFYQRLIVLLFDVRQIFFGCL